MEKFSTISLVIVKAVYNKLVCISCFKFVHSDLDEE